MQRIVYTQKPMRVPDRGCAIRRKMENQRRVAIAAVAVTAALVLTSAIVTGVRHANTAQAIRELPGNIVFIDRE